MQCWTDAQCDFSLTGSCPHRGAQTFPQIQLPLAVVCRIQSHSQSADCGSILVSAIQCQKEVPLGRYDQDVLLKEYALGFITTSDVK